MERNENDRRVENAVREQRLCTADKLQRPSGCLLYTSLDRVFHIEENIPKLHDAEYEAEMAEERSDDED